MSTQTEENVSIADLDPSPITTDMNFDDLTPIKVPVSIAGKKYELREATEEDSRVYENAMLARTQLGPDGKPQSVQGMADIQSLLVHLCLYDLSTNQRVKLEFVRSLAARIVKPLFVRAKLISELDETEDIERLEKQLKDIKQKIAALKAKQVSLKNGQSGTEDGSD